MYKESSKGWGNFFWPPYALQKLFTWQSFERTAYRTNEFRNGTTKPFLRRVNFVIGQLDILIKTYKDIKNHVIDGKNLDDGKKLYDYVWSQHQTIVVNCNTWITGLPQNHQNK